MVAIDEESFVEFRKEEIEQSLPERFARQVRLFPRHIAIKSRAGEITYEGLDAFSNRVARALMEKPGATAGPIALLFEPGIAMVAAILGVLKAGGFYLPLDPASPAARNSGTLESSGATWILTDSKCLKRAAALAEPRVRMLDVEQLEGVSDAPVELSATAGSLSCILYTSGSSGQPKGVVHNHRNFLHSIREHTNSMRLNHEDRISSMAYYGHVAGVTSMWRALLNGARLCIFNLRAEGWGELPRWISTEGITVYQSPPTLFRQWAQALTDAHRLPNLRILHLGGEPVTIQDVNLYRKYCPAHCILVHNLGSTEVPTFRQYFIGKGTAFESNLVPVGYAVQDKEVLLFNESGAEAAPDEAGEIVVRSRYFALEYWRNPDLTRQAFLPDRAGGEERLFRTGDLGRMRADGCLEHLGRKDRQIKIRGIRIEPAEIEAVLAQQPLVRQTVVVARDDGRGDKMLAAYILPAPGAKPSIRELREHLRERLPANMVPAAFVMLERFPLTPSGKVDQLALPAPGPTIRESDVPFVPPRTEIERTIVGIWEEVLGVPGVGVEDRFLDLGGNSLRAMLVITRLQNALGGALPLESLFDIATVAQQAAAVEKYLGLAAGADNEDQLLAELEAMTDDEAQKHLDSLVPDRKTSQWQTKGVSDAYLDVRAAIPGRDMEVDVMLKILRAWQPRPRKVIDLGCGDGFLGRTILDSFPDCHAWFLDFSEPMLDAARRALGKPDHGTLVKADFTSPEWMRRLGEHGSFDVIVSGLSIHHQTDARKRQLYAEIYGLLSPGGVFLNLEQVASATPCVEDLYCDYLIDHLHAFRQRSNPEKQREEIAAGFHASPARRENILAPVDIQCAWLREIGFQDTDCYFKVFEHALFGGRKPECATR